MATSPVERATLTIPEAARMLGVSKGSVYRLINEGRLHLTKIGARSLVTCAEVHRFLNLTDCEPQRADDAAA
jgi:excisionase family DNA binding protein